MPKSKKSNPRRPVFREERLEPEAIVLARRDAPVEISVYRATVERVGASWGGPRLRHLLTYRNRTPRAIAAVGFGLATFDLFDELIGCGIGLAVRPLAPAGAVDLLGHEIPPSAREWVEHEVDALAFQTAFAWVDRVRYQDGAVWRESRKGIAKKIRQLKGSFEVEPLERRTGE